MNNIYRTHNCGQLNIKNVGQEVRLSGWVQRIRNLGAMKFIDLRDQYGITQIVISDDEKFKEQINDIVTECVICIHGTVVERSNKNNKIPTGEIEIDAQKIEILGKCKSTLPFEVNSEKVDINSVREDLRLEYRFLDLRNDRIHNIILLRSQVMKTLRQKLYELGFSEIQTPILANSSPEGARDYLVPSRLHAGEFYALPQAPQQFKQLLMVSGIDKYFQIAPCFRDEDARADRAPGEFYQLDMEMAYATQEDVFSVMEPVVYNTFTKFSDKKVAEYPFPRIPYKEAMVKYGCDKPDLRNPLIIIDVTDFFQRCTFKPFHDRTVRAIKIKGHQSKGFHEKMLAYAQSIGMGGLGYLEVQEDMSYKGPIDKFIPDDMKSELKDLAGLEVEDTIFFIADNETNANNFACQIRNELGKRLDLIDDSLFQFCWIVDFPMYELDDNGDLAFCHNPFSMPKGGLEALNTMNPLDITADQYDIVCNGIELSSGAVRNHDPEIMEKAFEIVGYGKDVIEEKFSALYNAFQFGAPPHAGIAPGVDRMIMLLTESETIRDVIAFPMNSKAQDLLMGAPGNVTKAQLEDVHIKLDLPRE